MKIQFATDSNNRHVWHIDATIMLKAILIALLTLAAVSAFGQDAAQRTATVFYIPFSVQTYAPVTPSTIEASAFEIWTVSGDMAVSELLAALRDGAPATFDPRVVRVLVLVDGQRYYVDADGVASHEGGSLKIDRRMFDRLRASLPERNQRVIVK